MENPSKSHLYAGVRRNPFYLILSLALVLIALLGYWKVERIYARVLVLKQDVTELQNMAASPTLESVNNFGPLLSRTRADLDLLREEVRFLIWLGPWLKWVPVYGGDLAASGTLLDLADQLLLCAENTHAALLPMLAAHLDQTNLDPAGWISLLDDAQPELLQAQQAFNLAKSLRADLDIETLSVLTRTQLEKNLDPIMPLLEDGLSLAVSLPGLLGGSNEGPKTYLLLVQNEDELRPTGGFITAVGKIVFVAGKVADLDFSDSGELDNWDRPYPLAPWQLDRYMNSRVLVLRDSNWFTDFPTAALYAESLYAYNQSHSVDGVIAFDQQLLVLLLQVLGPLEVQGASVPIDSGNVISFMRASKSAPPDGQPIPDGWSRKGFIEDIARSIVNKMYSQGISWPELGRILLQGLEERHVLLVMDDATVSQVLMRRGWDGALNAGAGDFLMLVDANIGFNKTNALVETSIIYDVDLTNPDQWLGNLVVQHSNRSSRSVECVHWNSKRLVGEEAYPINACYWNYMRVYLPAGTVLLDANPQTVPNEWMILGRGQNGRVDILDQEQWEGVQAFGTLMVVPGGETVSSGFSFALPPGVLQEIAGSDQKSYQLTIRKQPGTVAIPITIRIHLPRSAALLSAPSNAQVEGDNILIQTDLRVDRLIMVIFEGK